MIINRVKITKWPPHSTAHGRSSWALVTKFLSSMPLPLLPLSSTTSITSICSKAIPEIVFKCDYTLTVNADLQESFDGNFVDHLLCLI